MHGTHSMTDVDMFALSAAPVTAARRGPATGLRERCRPALIRATDATLAVIAILAFAPLLLAVALAVYLTDRGPVVFAHNRLGRDGRVFRCLKFRSMVTNSQERLAELLARDPAALAEWTRDHKLRDDPRVTLIGAFLRKSSIDELPQLWNVLVGDMSFVGPRPIVHEERLRYGRYYRDYCSVRPGITGLWQVSGRNDVSYRRRVACDVLYSRTRSVRLNFVILAWTLPSVVLRRGSY